MMFRKILVGFAAVAIACLIARAGYHFGKHLAESDRADGTATSVPKHAS